MKFFFSNTISALCILCSLQLSAQSPVQSLRLSLTNPDDIYTELTILFMDDATDAMDIPHDKPLTRGNPDIAFYSKIGSSDFSEQALPPLTDDKFVQLAIDATISGTYALRLESPCLTEETVSIVLEDMDAGTMRNLRVQPVYWFSLNAGTNILRFKVHFNPPVGITVANGACDGTASLIELNQPGNYIWNYQIKDANNLVIDAATAWNGTLSLQNIAQGNYTISLSDTFGYTFTETVEVESKQPVVAQFQVSDSATAANSPVYFFDYSVGANNYSWDFGDRNSAANAPYPAHTYAAPGNYVVTFKAFNHDCEDISSKMITVVDVVSGMINFENNPPLVYSAGGEILVSMRDEKSGRGTVQVFSLLGKTIYNQPLGLHTLHRIRTDLGNGIYIVRVTTETQTHEQKVLVQF